MQLMQKKGTRIILYDKFRKGTSQLPPTHRPTQTLNFLQNLSRMVIQAGFAYFCGVLLPTPALTSCLLLVLPPLINSTYSVSSESIASQT